MKLKLLSRKKQTIPAIDKAALLVQRINDFNEKVKEINERLVNGEIGLAVWENLYRLEIAKLHVGTSAIGKGGWTELTISDWVRIGKDILDQYKFLHGWAKELKAKIKAGEDISLGLLNARGSLYGEAGKASYEKAKVSLTGIPIAELPAYPGDGSTICYTNCKCFWEIVVLDVQFGNYDAYWRLGIADHCETCINRSSFWSPLLVRDGIMVSQTSFPGVFR